MRVYLSRARLSVCLALLAIVPATTLGQGQQGDKKGLEAAFDSKTRARFKDLIDGDVQPNLKTDAAIAKAAAEYYIYRITHRASFNDKTFTAGTVQKEFDDKMVEIMTLKPIEKTVKKNRDFVNKLLSPALAKAMKDVLDVNAVAKAPATVIDAGIMFASMARLKDAAVTEFLAGLINDKATHDVLRLYALKGLKESMPIVVQQDPETVLNLGNAAQNAERSRDAKAVTALTGYIERNVNVAGMSLEEAEGIRYIRREAIISLAHAGAPAVLALNTKQVKGGKLDGPVAPTLLMVCTGAVNPPPSMQERIEAAIGLAIMKHPNMDEYDANTAVYLVGKTIVDFVDDYNRDLGKIAAIGAGRKLPLIAYRTDAKRLKEALIEFDRNAKGTKAGDLKAIAAPLLDSLLAATATTPFPQPDAGRLQTLRQEVQTTFRKAATGRVFKTLKAPVIPLN